jgi:predicted dehydrogenase
MSNKLLRIALVGCGAVAEQRHLPALARRNDCSLAALVDQNRERAKDLGRHFGNPKVVTDFRELLSMEIDAAIVAVPNHLHAAVSIELLRSGIHVLVEKPIALSAADCDEMVRVAQEKQVVLAVGMARRFIHASRFIKWAIDSDFIGRIHSIDIRDGYDYSWPITTDFPFRRETAGGGVLMDAGAHTLDQLLWWVGDPVSWEYYDDSAGGVESESLLHVTFSSGAKGTIELSRNRTLRNTARFHAERGEMEVSLLNNALWIRLAGAPVQVIGGGFPWSQHTAAPQSQIDIIQAEHDDFVEAVRTGRPPVVSGYEARQSLALIEACYAQKRPLQFPWSANCSLLNAHGSLTTKNA